MASCAKKNHTDPSSSTAPARPAATSKVAAITSVPSTPERDMIAAGAVMDNDEDIDWASSLEDEDANVQVSDYRMSHLHLKCFVHGANHRSDQLTAAGPLVTDQDNQNIWCC